MKQIIIILMILLTLPLVFAVEYVKTNEVVNDIIYCVDGNNICSLTTECNITVVSPDKSFLIQNQPMQQSNNLYNYTLTYPINGEYTNIYYCQDTTASMTTKKVISNPSGSEINNNLAIITYSIIGLLILIYFAGGFLVGNQHTLMKVSLFFGSLINLIIALLMVYIEHMNTFATEYMVLSMFTVNSIFIIGIVWYYIYFIIMHQAAQDEEDMEDDL
jgi:hypothetical protein